MEARTERFNGQIAQEWNPGRGFYLLAAAAPAFPARGGGGWLSPARPEKRDASRLAGESDRGFSLSETTRVS